MISIDPILARAEETTKYIFQQNDMGKGQYAARYLMGLDENKDYIQFIAICVSMRVRKIIGIEQVYRVA